MDDTSHTTRNYIRSMITSLSHSLSQYFDGSHFEYQPIDEFNNNNNNNNNSGSHFFEHSYSKPFLVLDIIWNMGFVFVAIFVLLCTLDEKPLTPLRVWIVGYAFQCVLHVGFVSFGYQRRFSGSLVCFYGSVLKKLESANTIASSLWWVFGFYWIVTGGQSLLHDSPRLYWLAVAFLAVDVFFMIFCIGLACIICLAFFCCVPIVAIAYAMTITEGASEEEIRLLPKYRFHQSCAPIMSTSQDVRRPTDEVASQFEHSECCICLMQYIEGAELCSLPCNHHFHYGCISRWLRINATCPLCKFNIKAKGDTLV